MLVQIATSPVARIHPNFSQKASSLADRAWLILVRVFFMRRLSRRYETSPMNKDPGVLFAPDPSRKYVSHASELPMQTKSPSRITS